MQRRFVSAIVIVHLICTCGFAVSAKPGSKNQRIDFISKPSDNKIDITVDGKLFTSFCWPDNVYKPILYPVLTSTGTEITRGFPLKPKAGEREDHIHQVGIWLNYGNVNGLDFWGNGSRGFREPGGGVIKHLAVEKLKPGVGEGVLFSSESWIDPKGKELLAEKSEYHFIARDNQRIIDRITTLTAGDTAVIFKDTKEGMFGIRVARELELPSDEKVILIDSEGNPSKEKVISKKGVSGNFRSSEGLTGDGVWGSRAKWMALDGIIGNEKISVVICDHQNNQSYPTYWHARGYGLFAANPLGWSDFTKGKEVLGFSIPAGKSVTFKYRVIISSGDYLNIDALNKLSKNFSSKYSH
jgi:hypothetical protein